MVPNTLACAAGALLLIAGIAHLRDSAHLEQALRTYVSPTRSRRVASWLPLYELALGLALVVLPATDQTGWLSVVGAVTLVTGSLFSWHITSRLGEPAPGPCGCTSRAEPTTKLALVRSSLVAIGGIAALSTALLPSPTLATASVEVFIATTAGVSLAAIAYQLPTALAINSENLNEIGQGR